MICIITTNREIARVISFFIQENVFFICMVQSLIPKFSTLSLNGRAKPNGQINGNRLYKLVLGWNGTPVQAVAFCLFIGLSKPNVEFKMVC